MSLALYDRTADAVRDLYDRRIQEAPVLSERRFFPQAHLFRENWQDIRDEAAGISEGRLAAIPRFHELMEEQKEISANDGRDWRLFILKAYGREWKHNLARCPRTAAILAQCPSVLSASFSFLAPGKHIPEHRGPFRGVVRFHLGLSMPRKADGKLGAVLWVDGEPHYLDDGGTLLWDDTYPHEVLNATDGVRVALLLDVWRANMPADLRALSSLIVGFVRTAMLFRPSYTNA
ncbi:MAG TPA: aspartyl/asparaginyl beta-hydroxylase domain-containing protein [Rhizomicrobium sp.]